MNPLLQCFDRTQGVGFLWKHLKHLIIDIYDSTLSIQQSYIWWSTNASRVRLFNRIMFFSTQANGTEQEAPHRGAGTDRGSAGIVPKEQNGHCDSSWVVFFFETFGEKQLHWWSRGFLFQLVTCQKWRKSFAKMAKTGSIEIVMMQIYIAYTYCINTCIYIYTFMWYDDIPEM